MEIHEYCRVCTSRNQETLSIYENYKFPESNLRIFEVITKCASVQIQRLDGFSERICKRCTEHLRQAFSFKRLCEESDYKFRHNLIDAHKIEPQDANCHEATKIRFVEVYVNEINADVTLSGVKPEIKCEYNEEDAMIQYEFLHEEALNFTAPQNFDASSQETNRAILDNKKSQTSELNMNFPCNYEQINCTKANGEINGENGKCNIPNEAGFEIKSEFRMEESVPFGNLKNQHEETSSTSQNLTGESSVNPQKSNEDLHDFCEQSTTILNEDKARGTDEEHTETIFIKQHSPASNDNETLIIHQAEKPYKYTKSTQLTLKQENLHAEEKPYKCEACGKSFKRKEHLNLHTRFHTGEKPFTCDICDKSFVMRGKLNNHRRTHTGEKPYKCESCDKCFALKEHLNIHIRIHTGDKRHECDVCSKCYTDPSALSRHRKKHTGEKPHKCETCGKSFRIKTALNIHYRTHTGEKPYKCEFCDKCFAGKTNLNVHMRIHTGEKPYKCETCDKFYAQKKDLILHERVHTGEIPFKCEVCDKCFKRKENLMSHKRSHTGERPYTCEICYKGFIKRAYLIQHNKIHDRIIT